MTNGLRFTRAAKKVLPGLSPSLAFPSWEKVEGSSPLMLVHNVFFCSLQPQQHHFLVPL